MENTHYTLGQQGEKDMNQHPEYFNQAKTIVIKIGSAQLLDQQGQLRKVWFQTLCQELATLKKAGKTVLLVSSGAVALGRRRLKDFPSHPSLAQNQAAAASGQITLCQSYEHAMAQYHIHTAQLLLTIEDCYNLRRQLNAKNTLKALLSSGLLPIINENDTVATDELRLGDNDRLAAHICHLVKADVLVLLSDVDGLYNKDPSQHFDAHHIPVISEINDRITAMGGPKQSAVGTGGMFTKIEAAKIATHAGCHMVIAKGNQKNPLQQLAKQNAHCTWFLAQHSPLNAGQQWLKHLKPNGKLYLDIGAVNAVKSGKNLLASGIVKTTGHFQKGDAVELLDINNTLIAKGVCHYHAGDLQKILGKHSDQIAKILGYHNGNAVIHSDYTLLL